MQNMHQKITKDFDLSVTILMGVVTVLTAFFAFCASVWSSTSVANYSKANTELNEANTTYLEYNNAYIQDDLRELRLINGGLSEKDAEQETNEANKNLDDLYAEYELLIANSDSHMMLADEANAAGDKFQLVTVIFATILFLSSLALTTKKERSRYIFFYFSLCIFLFTIIYSLTLNFPTF